MKNRLLAALCLALGSVGTAQSQTVLITTPSVLRTIPLYASQVAADPASGLLYAAATDGSGQNGVLTTIDTATGATVSATPLGDRPGPIAVSGDGKYVYVGLNNRAVVQPYNTQTRTLGAAFALGVNPYSSPPETLYADNIQVMPGHDQTLGIALRNNYYSPRGEGVAIYDSGVMRPGLGSGNYIQFNETGDALCGITDEFTTTFVTHMTVDAAGLHTGYSNYYGVPGNPIRMAYAGGLAYLNNGYIFDPVKQQAIGKFNLPHSYASTPAVLADAASRRVYFLQSPFVGNVDDGQAYLDTFNMDTGQLLSDTLLYTGFPEAHQLVALGPGEMGVYADFNDGQTAAGRFFVIATTPEPGGWALLCGMSAAGLGRVAQAEPARHWRKGNGPTNRVRAAWRRPE